MKPSLPLLHFCCQTLCSAMPNPKSISTAANPAVIRRLRRNQRQNLVVIMGATGAGKSRLSVDLASRFSGEIINSDKIQLYRGLDITTNKIPLPERAGVPHHLLGDFDSSAGDVSPSEYSSAAAAAISDVHSRGRVPFLVGGSNSLIHALLSGSASSDPFTGSGLVCPGSNLRYRCCFLWVDVAPHVLNEYLGKRVDEMFDSGMLSELAQFYSSEIYESKRDTGLRKAIGIPEFEDYFGGEGEDRVYEEAVSAIKENTCRLAKRQVGKIERLRRAGWDLRKLDATDAFRGVLEGNQRWRSDWESQVVQPSVQILNRFLQRTEVSQSSEVLSGSSQH